MLINVYYGDILDYKADVIVNAWNRNFIHHRLLLSQGVSKAIKKKSGLKPFNEVFKYGLLDNGQAVFTSAGKLEDRYKGIIHVAGINGLWKGTAYNTKESTTNAIKLALEKNYKSLVIPLIGSGTGSVNENKALCIMIDSVLELSDMLDGFTVNIVVYDKNKINKSKISKHRDSINNYKDL